MARVATIAKKGCASWFEKVMGFPAPPLQGDAFLDVTLEHLFANVWSRPALGVRSAASRPWWC